MIKAKCTKIYRDKNNVIIAYDIVSNNNSKHIKKDELKALIKANKLSIDNLKLTNDGRLVSVGMAKETNLRDKLMGAGNAGIVYQGLRYYISDGQVTVRAENKKIKAANILNGTEVIDTGAFRDCDNLEKAVIPQTVKVIKEGAFENCTKLKKINFPNSLTRIGKYAFSRCTGLGRVDIPAHLIKVSAQAFYDRSRDTVMKYWGLTPVQADQFKEKVKCTDVKRDNNIIVGYIVIGTNGYKACITPDDLKTLMQAGKVDVVNLALKDDKIIFKSDIKNVEGTTKSVTRNIPLNTTHKVRISNPIVERLRAKIRASKDNIYKYEGLEYYLLNEDAVAVRANSYEDYKSYLKEFKILEGTEIIDEYSFYDAETDITGDVERIIIPSTVTKIVLSGLPHQMTSIVVDKNNKIYASQDGVLFNKNKTELLFYPHCKKGKYEIPVGVQLVGSGAFMGSNLTTVDIPNSVTQIGNCAFLDCDKLVNITVSSENRHYSTLDGVLFNKDKTILICCPGGKRGKYRIPNGVQVIKESAFTFCSWLQDIEIPESVLSIEKDAFSACSRLENVLNLSHIIKIEEYTFAQCFRLKNVTIPNSVVSIADHAFEFCINLRNIVIPQSVTDLTLRAFIGCENLIEIVLPKHLNKVIFDDYISDDIKAKIKANKIKFNLV